MASGLSLQCRRADTQVGRFGSVQISLCGEISPALLEQAHPIPPPAHPARPRLPRPPPPAHHTLARSTHAIARSHARSPQHVRIRTHARLMPSCRCAIASALCAAGPAAEAASLLRVQQAVDLGLEASAHIAALAKRVLVSQARGRRVACACCNGLSRFSVARARHGRLTVGRCPAMESFIGQGGPCCARVRHRSRRFSVAVDPPHRLPCEGRTRVAAAVGAADRVHWHAKCAAVRVWLYACQSVRHFVRLHVRMRVACVCTGPVELEAFQCATKPTRPFRAVGRIA